MKEDKLNILITAVSRKSDLVLYFRRALKKLKVSGDVIGVDCDRLSPALYLADKGYIVRRIEEDGYYDEVLEIARRENVKMIVPTMDLELLGWAEVKKKASDMGIFVLISDRLSIEKSIDKFKTYEFFKSISIPTPETISYGKIKSVNDSMFPLFVKPRFGRGSEDSYRVSNYRELSFYLWKIKEPVIQRYLDGCEFTVDVLNDFGGRFLTAVPRKRLLVRAGVSDRGVTFYDRKIIEFSKRIAEELKLVGPSNIQGKVNEDGIYFFEINPRFSGGISLTIESGADFPKLILKMLLGRRILKRELEFDEEIYMSSYSSHVFLDRKKLLF